MYKEAPEGVEAMSNENSTNQQSNGKALPEFPLPEVVVTAPRYTWYDWYGILQNIFAVKDPQSNIFTNPTLNYQDFRAGYRLRENPLGIGLLWRETASGRVHPDDVKQYMKQDKTLNSHILPAAEDAVTKLPFNAEAGTTVGGDGYFTANQSESSTIDKLKNYLSQHSEFVILEVEALTDTALGEMVISKLRNTFTIGKQSAPGLGPAGTLEVRVDTTPGGVITLKGVAKVFGGVVSLGQTSYDVYVDYKTFGFTENFAKAAALDIGVTVVAASVSGAVVSFFGYPVIVVSLAGGFVTYLVNKSAINPWKESLETQQ